MQTFTKQIDVSLLTTWKFNSTQGHLFLGGGGIIVLIWGLCYVGQGRFQRLTRINCLLCCTTIPSAETKVTFTTTSRANNNADGRVVLTTIPNDARYHWFNGDWIVQPRNTNLLLKVQR